jgi:RNA-binding protein
MLSGKQRAFLRGKANGLETIFQVGKGGINENLLTQLEDALEARELVKARVLENSGMTAREAGDEIAEKIGADCVCAIGTRFTLYKESKKHKQYSLMIKTL